MELRFYDIWLEIRMLLQKNGELPNVSSDSVAREVGVSAAQISRLKNGKSNLTNEVIEKIVARIEKIDGTYAEGLREKLKGVQSQLIENKLVDADGYGGDAIKAIEGLFDTLADSDHALLCVEFRDIPQGGAMPHFAEVAGQAVKNGLCLAMFQPFGPAEELLKMQEKYLPFIKKSLKTPNANLPHAKMAVLAYMDLFTLAVAVRKVYGEIWKHSGYRADGVALYEAERKAYPLNAIGAQSRMFYARYQNKDKIWTPKIYDWVTSLNDRDLFVERNEPDVSFRIIRAEFHPVSTFWSEKNGYKLPVNMTRNRVLDQAYNQAKWDDWGVRWQNWTPPRT